jgi:glycosyltransferase involved in cell wall biosynthesis
MTAKPIRALFVPGNVAHVRTQLPVAAELARRGHDVAFLVRDRMVAADYRVAPLLAATGQVVHDFDGFYETDLGRRFPRLAAYGRSRRDVTRALDALGFDLAVLCNDDSALFDRLVVDFCRRGDRRTLLIQESVRPAQRRLGLGRRIRHQGLSAVAGGWVQSAGSALLPGPFTRRGYAHGGCDLIAAAGDCFRRRLMDEGVAAERIRVTGQPRLDALEAPPAGPLAAAGDEAVLLFCSQPIPAPPRLVDRLFVELVAACEALPKVRLLFKLHPRDLPEEHWRGLLGKAVSGEAVLGDRVEVTKTRPLAESFRTADAMMTVASTTALEAMAAGLPVGLVDYLPTPWYLPYEERGAALSVRSRSELPDAVRRLLRDRALREGLTAHAGQVLQDELYLRDGHSAERIADFIEERLRG